MKLKILKTMGLLGIALMLLILNRSDASSSLPSAGADYHLNWTGMGVSAVESVSSPYRLIGGSAEAFTATSSSNGYSLTGGFLAGLAWQGYYNYIPLAISP